MLIRGRLVPAFCACQVFLRIRGLVARCETQDGGRAGVWVLRECPEEPQGPGGFRQNSIARYWYLVVKMRDKKIRKPSSPDPPFTADSSVVAIFTLSACFSALRILYYCCCQMPCSSFERDPPYIHDHRAEGRPCSPYPRRLLSTATACCDRKFAGNDRCQPRTV